MNSPYKRASNAEKSFHFMTLSCTCVMPKYMISIVHVNDALRRRGQCMLEKLKNKTHCKWTIASLLKRYCIVKLYLVPLNWAMLYGLSKYVGMLLKFATLIERYCDESYQMPLVKCLPKCHSLKSIMDRECHNATLQFARFSWSRIGALTCGTRALEIYWMNSFESGVIIAAFEHF